VAHALHKKNRSQAAVGQDILDRVDAVLLRRQRDPARPSITLAYAQSLDGCISEDQGVPTAISDCHSQVLTHQLRAMHDAVLVGINTVMVDNPRLTVRLVPGTNPIPVIVDSNLRIPVDVRLLQQVGIRPLVAATRGACEAKRSALSDLGADVLHVGANPDGSVDLEKLFEMLCARGIRSVMIEGGAKIITSVLAAELADQLVLTISPRFLGGVRSVESLFGRGCNRKPGLRDVFSQSVGNDLVVHGELLRSAHAPG
jgi:3,4-dihydroxy 2-butanone 4-phosphate synthase/GTP cyclohydrolase II